MNQEEIKPVKIETRESCYKGRTIEVVEERLSRPDGKSYIHTSVVHPGAVVVIPRLTANSYLMVRQYRHSIGKMLLEFPAGTLEKGEVPRVCAEREIQEEIKYSAKTWVDLGTLYPAPGFCSERQYLFLASDLFESAADSDEDEIINSEEVNLASIERMIASGEIEDAKSIAAFTRARLKGLL